MSSKTLIERLDAIPEPSCRSIVLQAMEYIRTKESEAQWYDAHTAIAAYAAPLVLKLSEEAISCPMAFVSVVEDSGDSDINAWKDVLKEIYWGLQVVVVDDIGLSHEDQKRLQASMELFGKWFTHLWD